MAGPGRSAAWLLAALLVPCALATVVGLILLWPGHREYPVPVQFAGPNGARPQFVTGAVDEVEDGPCHADRTLTGLITDPALDVPTTVAPFGPYLYAVNARFSTPPTPTTEYTVVRLPSLR